MSELMNARSRNESFRRNLLTNASMFALCGYLWAPSAALASSDGDRPTVWIELGGQLERVDGENPVFAPAFFGFASPEVTGGLVDAQRPYRYGAGLEGKVSLLPKGTDWVLSAALRYGRANSAKHSHYQTSGQPSYYATFNHIRLADIKPNRRIFGDAQTNYSETHLVLDFQAGKDVGLGRLGPDGSSVFSVGVRYAQFTSRSSTGLNALPVYGHWSRRGINGAGKYAKSVGQFRQTYTAVLHAARSTRAIGPSLSWDASVPIAGREQDATVALDWGVNASLLFGRQKVQEDHNTTGYYLGHNTHAITFSSAKIVRRYAQGAAHSRSRSVTVPNVGGFAGFSLKFPNAKVSLGYRADFFFNATDGGIDTHDAANRNFYGPFATISIGLGG